MLRNKLKKEGVEPKVGDKVAISEFKIVTEDDVLKNHCAVITKILARKNELNKPNISNIDQVVIVTSTYNPDFNPLLLDKFIVLSESHNITPLICVNKSDRIDDELKDYFENTYKKIGYEVVYTSAIKKNGINELLDNMIGKVSVLTGVSGSGKSSLINSIDPSLKLNVSEVSKTLGSGRHTTRHVSLQKLKYKGNYALIADTPGFSYIELNYIQPKELAWNFIEFAKYITSCPKSDCLHWQEPDCNLRANIEEDDNRYLSYINLLQDVIDFQKLNNNRSSKKETQVKVSKRADGKNIRVVKLTEAIRENSRRVIKQDLAELGKLTDIDDIDEEY
jgi:ribosome biogenesis GTPase